jgi:hypothetical protein
VLVTVVSRNKIPDRPVLAPIADLGPYMAEGAVDHEEIRNWLRDKHDG